MKRKILADTSCVFAFVDRNIEPTLSAQIPRPDKRNEYWTGHYLRMEFFRRWVQVAIEVFCYAKMCRDIGQTLSRFSHSFSGRDVKAVLKWAGKYINDTMGMIRSQEDAIEQFGMMVYGLARVYDKLFSHYVAPKAGCAKGQVDFNLDAPRFSTALEQFYAEFTKPAHACRINALLQIERGCPRAKRVLAPSKGNLEKLDAVSAESRRALRTFHKEKLAKIVEKGGRLDCSSCHQIGDLIIVLEQPPSWFLYHTDHIFEALCELYGHNYVKLKSVAATAPPISAALPSSAQPDRRAPKV